MRARAIENQVYMVAPAVYGTFPPHDEWSYGRSMIVDPWGLITAQASDQTSVITADLDINLVEEIRKRMPTLNQRRPDVYKWEEFNN